MSGFQKRFMKIAETAHNTNLDLVQRYKEDSIKVADELYRELAELQHVKAHLGELKERSKLKIFFDGLEYRFNAGLKKFSLELTEDANETYKSYEKKLKNLFIEEGVSKKDIYHCIDEKSDSEYSVFTAKAGNINLETSLLRDVQTQISDTSEKIIKKSERKRTILAFVVPIVLILLLIIGKGIAENGITNAIAGIISSLGVEEELAGNIAEAGGGIGSFILNFFSSPVILVAIAVPILVIIAIWLIYYKIIEFNVNKDMIQKLEQAMAEIYQELVARKGELQEAYAEWLISHINEMNTNYFIKYKPLIDMVMNQDGGQ